MNQEQGETQCTKFLGNHITCLTSSSNVVRDVTVEFTENQGRFTVAQRDIPTGTVVLRYIEGHTHAQGPWYSGTQRDIPTRTVVLRYIEEHTLRDRGTLVH